MVPALVTIMRMAAMADSDTGNAEDAAKAVNATQSFLASPARASD